MKYQYVFEVGLAVGGEFGVREKSRQTNIPVVEQSNIHSLCA